MTNKQAARKLLCVGLTVLDAKLKVVLLVTSKIGVAHEVKLCIEAALGSSREGKRKVSLGLKKHALDGKQSANTEQRSRGMQIR